MATKYPKVTVNHDWLGVRLGNNRSFSTSWGGCKATGKIPEHVFDVWEKVTRHDPEALKQIGIKGKANLEEVVRAFADNIGKIWPEWNNAPVLPSIGDNIIVNFGKRKGNITGEVKKLRATMVTADFGSEGIVKVPADMIKEIKKK